MARSGPKQATVWTYGATSILSGRQLMPIQSYAICVGAGRIVNGYSTGITNYLCS